MQSSHQCDNCLIIIFCYITTLTIQIPDKVEKTISDLVEQMGGKVIVANNSNKLSKTAKKKRILDDLEESVKWVKLHQEGKVEAKSIGELLNEL